MIQAFWGELQPYLMALWAKRWFRVCFWLFLVIAIGRILQDAHVLN
jgi:hypothetical protein